MKFFLSSCLIVISLTSLCQPLDSLLQVRGFCIAAPAANDLERFTQFMKEDLAANGINTLVLRVDFKYEDQSDPQLRGDNPLTKAQVKQLVQVAKDSHIRLIPQINLLGHQSWHSELTNLLKEFPQFDETPHVQLPEKYEWPNDDGLYCKSYCPLHPDVHEVVFALVDEILEVFEADAFHAGMDEVFYIGDEKCPRCAGKDKAALFAGEVTKIRDHLKENDRELWIWGDRLLDGNATGLGMWEASENNTHQAIDLIPKDVIICDWHYEKPEPTAAYFAIKGLKVVSCPWRKPEVATGQIDLMKAFKEGSNDKVKDRYHGVMQTIWTSASNFMDLYYGKKEDENAMGQVHCFKAMVAHFKTL
ncbi:MAG: family 20 glycosylhydrolase [Cyclobacteriaceae bacterium]